MAIQGGSLRERVAPIPGAGRGTAYTVIDRCGRQYLRFGNQFQVHIAERVAVLRGEHIVVPHHFAAYRCGVERNTRIGVARIIRKQISAFAGCHRLQTDARRIAVVRLHGALDLKVIRSHQVGGLRVTNRPRQLVQTVITLHLVFLLRRAETIDAVECRDIDAVGATRGGGGHIGIGLHGKGSLEAALNTVSSRHDDRAGAVGYVHRCRIERSGIGLGRLIYDIRNSHFAIFHGRTALIQQIQVR